VSDSRQRMLRSSLMGSEAAVGGGVMHAEAQRPNELRVSGPFEPEDRPGLVGVAKMLVYATADYAALSISFARVTW